MSGREVEIMGRIFAAFVALFLAAAVAQAGEKMGPLPPGAISQSEAGPSDELVGYLALDPRLIEGQLPHGVRFLTLEEKAKEWPRLAKYLEQHPERRAWVWSFYEIILLRAARYDAKVGHFDNGGMAVWYVEVAQTDAAEKRPLGDQYL